MVKRGTYPADFSPINIGDRDIFNSIFHQYYKTLCYFAERITESHSDAEDIVEELFVKLWNKQQPFESEQHLKAFLYRSTKNACLDFLKLTERANNRHTLFFMDNDQWEESYLNEIIRAEVLREVYNAIEHLPPQCSKIITMSYIDGKSNQEIAEELGLSLQTVKNQKGRGLSILKGKLPYDKYQLLLLVPYLHLLQYIHQN